MSDNVKFEVEIPAEIAAIIQDVREKSGLTIEELLIGASELLYTDATQQTMKRVMRNTFARRFQSKLANFTARTRKPANGNESEA